MKPGPFQFCMSVAFAIFAVVSAVAACFAQPDDVPLYVMGSIAWAGSAVAAWHL